MRAALLTVAAALLLLITAVSAGDLRFQVAELRRELRLDRRRLSALERAARAERDAPAAAVPDDGLLDIVAELGREVSALADELRRRQGLEQALEELAGKASRGEEQIARLTREVERLKEEQWSVDRVVSQDFSDPKTGHKPISFKVNPFSEEGSGDFAEDSLIPVNREDGKENNVPKGTIPHFEVIRRQHWIDLRRLEERTQEKLSNVSKQIEQVDIKVQSIESHCNRAYGNVTDDVKSSMALLENLQDDLGNLWKRISQAEFNAAQSQAVLDVLEHDWKEESKRIRELQTNVNVTRLDLSSHNVRLLSVEAAAANLSLQRCRSEADSGRRSLQLQTVELRLEQRLDSLARGQRADEAAFRALRDALASVSRRVENASAEVTLVQDVQEGMRVDLGKFIKRLPKDCSREVHSGLTLIQVPPLHPYEAFCDADAPGGPWLTIQRRTDGSVNFHRGWSEYRQGFGHPSGEFWLGNELLHRLTRDGSRKLRVDMGDAMGRRWFAQYALFRVGSEAEQYALDIAGHSGNASDALGQHFGMGFSTHDRDNDASSANCAAHHTGGWWYQHCHKADLNGRYSLGMTWYTEKTHEWLQLVWVEMKIASNQLQP